MNIVRWTAHKVWMIAGIPVWCFTEEGPVGWIAGAITDWWIEVADAIEGSPNANYFPRSKR
jgi:hypothetical protein